MNRFLQIMLACLLVAGFPVAHANEQDALKVAALEALMAAPPERALPILQRVLAGDDSVVIKSRALFVLSQIDEPEAHTALGEAARSNSGDLQFAAIRMIGISGAPEAMANLPGIYAAGDIVTRQAVLQAYLIADDSQAVYDIAVNASDTEEFAAAVHILGAMGATEQIRALGERGEVSATLLQAYAMAGDSETLVALARDDSDPEAQLGAIRALGMVGAPDLNATLLDIYRSAESETIREAALEALMVADDEDSLLELFRESQDPAEKRTLLRTLVMMDSDAVWDLVDAALEVQSTN